MEVIAPPHAEPRFSFLFYYFNTTVIIICTYDILTQNSIRHPPPIFKRYAFSKSILVLFGAIWAGEFLCSVLMFFLNTGRGGREQFTAIMR